MDPIQTNRPPAEVDPIQERLTSQYEALLTRAAALIDSLGRVPPVIDHTSIDRAVGFAKQLKLLAKEAEDARKTEGADFLRAKRTIDSFFSLLAGQLKVAIATVEMRMDDYLAANGKVRGALGGIASLKTSLEFEIVDHERAAYSLAAYMDETALVHATRALIRANKDDLLRQLAAGEQPVAGIRFYEANKVRVA